MAIDQAVISALRMAAHAAGQAFVAVASAAYPLTCVSLDANGLSHSTTLAPAGRQGGREERGALLRQQAPREGTKCLLFSEQGPLSDSMMTHALFIEFGASPALLDGLVLALPYAPPVAGKAMAAGMVQAIALCAGCECLIDELLPLFVDSLSRLDGRKWLTALEYDRRDEPSQSRFEATCLPLPRRCPSLRRDAPSPDSNEALALYLDALVERYPFDEGIAFREALYQLELDFSEESLSRVDFLLGQLAPTLSMTAQEFMLRPANMNFLYCLAAYCSQVLAKGADSRLSWYTAAQYRARSTPGPDLPAGPEASLVGVFNEGEEDGGQRFLPVAMLLQRLFGGKDGTWFRMVMKAMWNTAHKGRPRQLNDEWPLIEQLFDSFPATKQRYLSALRPTWADQDPLGLWYQHYLSLFDGGTVVWGCLVQANGRLWDKGEYDHPGEILYDPRGVSTPDQLQRVADKLYSYKGCRLHDPRLAFYADYLTHEMTRGFGVRVPYCVASEDLCSTTLMFIRQHLPGEHLQSRFLPLLINDRLPGIAMALPGRFWTPALKAACAQYGWTRSSTNKSSTI